MLWIPRKTEGEAAKKRMPLPPLALSTLVLFLLTLAYSFLVVLTSFKNLPLFGSSHDISLLTQLIIHINIFMIQRALNQYQSQSYKKKKVYFATIYHVLCGKIQETSRNG